MATPLSVSQALALAKSSLEQIAVTIVGEVSELSDKPGYKAVYFTLTDAGAALSCLMWRGNYQRTGLNLRQGMLVEVSGIFSVYAAKGRMNFDAKTLRLAGEGELRLRVAQLARKLEAEGLMSPQNKRALPRYPAAVALVTSPRGKAVHDVLRTLRRRYPLTEVLIAGVPVEGAGAAERIIEGLQAVQSSGAEVILLVRGGGSYEDLMPFNDERLARAIAASTLPVVTGIGHEPDNSIADMVADFRASTPTAAAEHVVPDSKELATALQRTGMSLAHALRLVLQRSEAIIGRLRQRPLFTEATALLRGHDLALEGAAHRLSQALPSRLERDLRLSETLKARMTLLASKLLPPFTATVAVAAARLDSLSPLAVLSRGYSIAYGQDGHIIDTIDAVDLSEQLRVRLADGSLECTVEGKRREALIAQNTEAHHV
ncbi:MAG: exodeoxyribonuclease VII large subunit [Coriobacteriales bacterium]|jgi:exodeoxyribonuclease VII large subunit|nr:exodeoxyribonuclease VII large subunit [Coriobacteriales bacterium]